MAKPAPFRRGDRLYAHALEKVSEQAFAPQACNVTQPSPRPIIIRNDSGADVDQFRVLGLNTPAVAPADNPAEFKAGYDALGVTPGVSHIGRFAVVQGPIANGSTGKAIYSGLTNALVEVPSGTAALTTCDVDPVTHKLTMMAGGSADVIWKESSGTTRLARIRIGNAAPTTVRWGITTTPSLVGGSSVYPNPASQYTADFNPVYTVQLGTIAWSESDRVQDNAMNNVDTIVPYVPFRNEPRLQYDFALNPGAWAYPELHTNFVPDSPTTTIRAASTIGHIHEGSPVICQLISGRWYIIGPEALNYSTYECNFGTSGWWPSNGGSQTNSLTLTTPAIMTAPTAALSGGGSYESYDVLPLTVSAYGDYGFRIKRSGDYEISMHAEVDGYVHSNLQAYATTNQILNSISVVSSGPSTGTSHTHGVMAGITRLLTYHVAFGVTTKTPIPTFPALTTAHTLGAVPVSVFLYPNGTVTTHKGMSYFSRTFGLQQGTELRLHCGTSDTYGSSSFGFTLGTSSYTRLTIKRLGHRTKHYPTY